MQLKAILEVYGAVKDLAITSMRDQSVVVFENLEGAVAASNGTNGKVVQEKGRRIEAKFLDLAYVSRA